MKKEKSLFLHIGFCTLLFISISSCDQDILDRKPLNAYSETIVWSNLDLVETFVNSKYRALANVYRRNTSTYLPNALSLSAASSEGFSQWGYDNVRAWNFGNVTPDNTSMDAWRQYYVFIRSCNYFFQNIDAVQGDTEKKDRLIGEMKFIRAWSYFDLISRYGGVPLITKVYTLSDSDYMTPRSTYDECLNFIVSELDGAVDLLPIDYTGNDVGRITKGAALALKSRALLYAASSLNNPSNDQNKWITAADAAKAVIDLGVYTFYQGDYQQIFLEKFNSEIILSYNLNATRNDFLGSYENRMNVYFGPNGYHGWSAYTPSQYLVDQFEMINGKMISEAGSGYDPANPYLNRDPRFYADILFNGAEFRGRAVETFEGGLDSPQSPIENWNASKNGYSWRKYANEAEPIDENLGSSQNWIMFRLAEIYLNYAEAKYESGDEPTARDYLNLVRGRVDMPAVLTSGTDLLKAIRHEREIELCLEGHRFFDVRRWKIAMETENQPLKGVHIIKEPNGTFTYLYPIFQDRKFLEQHYLFPIPNYETNRNMELTKNPGY